MATCRYRINGGEVIAISEDDQQFPVNQFWERLDNVLLPDGPITRDIDGNLKVLGLAKFADVAANTARNATQPEIDNFIVQEGEDQNDIDAGVAKAQIGDPGTPQRSSINSKQLKADIKTTVGALNREKDVKWRILVDALRNLVSIELNALGGNAITQAQLQTELERLGGNTDDVTNQEYKEAYFNNVDRLD